MTEPSAQFIRFHMSIRWKNCIMVLSKFNTQVVWLFNLWTEQWRKYDLPHKKCLPVRGTQQGVEIGSDIYIFDGHATNEVWKLTRSTKALYSWNTLQTTDRTKTPSERIWYSMWKYDEKMWIFGGYGPPLDGYLNDYGDFTTTPHIRGYNNQLLSYDPFCQMWINVACSGDVPVPRAEASSAIVNDRAYLLGGQTHLFIDNDLYELNMHSITWTRIETTGGSSTGYSGDSLIPVLGNKLARYGGCEGSIWIFDTHSHTWKELLGNKVGCDYHHTGITGLHGSAVILGKTIQPQGQAYNPVITVRIEPKSLQQFAMQTVYHKVDRTFWGMLPKKLTRKMTGIEL